MYVYLYDNYLKQKRFESVMKTLETRLTDFGIAGKIVRLQNFTNAEAVIEDEIKKGAKTVVIVGNDTTFGHVLSRAATCQVLFGFLPIGEQNNSIAGVLGIPIGIDSCETLSRRRKVYLDVGWVNNKYFISQLHIAPANLLVEYDEKFAVKSRGAGALLELVVCNLQPYTLQEKKGPSYTIHPQDGKLEAFLRPLRKKRFFGYEYEEPSVFPFEEMVVSSETPFVLEADGRVTKETRLKIRLAKKQVQMVVGKQRKF